MPPRFLTMSEVLLIAQDQVRRYGGAFGVRDPSLLSSALAMPSAAFQGEYLHQGLSPQAAAYAVHLCQNHPFIDGNTRTALAAARVFLDLNGIEISDPSAALYKLMMQVAEGKKGKAEIAGVLEGMGRRKEQTPGRS